MLFPKAVTGDRRTNHKRDENITEQLRAAKSMYFNSVLFSFVYLFTCCTNSPKANYIVSTSKEKTHRNKIKSEAFYVI
jgi:hypothetical protein